jgi:hypothetical protein
MAKRKNGLFTHVERPLPGTANSGCIVYGTAGEGVDTGVYCDSPGTLYFGLVAIRELAECAGFSVNEEGEKLEKDLAFALHRIEELEAEKDDLVEQLDAVSLVMARAQARK